MEDRKYIDLTWLPSAAADPVARHEQEGLGAARLAHNGEIDQIVDSLKHGQSVLVTCGKGLAPYLQECLASHFPANHLRHVTGQPSSSTQGDPGAISLMVRELRPRLRDAKADNAVVVIGHLDLMSCTIQGQPRSELNEVVYWMTTFSSVVKLAFWDPIFPLPKVVEDLFPVQVSLQIFSREKLWEIISPDEARKLSPSPSDLTISAQLRLYQYVSGTHVAEVRRLLRDIAERFSDCSSTDDTQQVLNHIRERTIPSDVHPAGDWNGGAGYADLQKELKKKVLFPVGYRNRAKTKKELAHADALIPRGVILYGPPGTGKTEWAKFLARELGATLIVVNGPELKNRWVGETEAAIRRLFARARRLAPSLILIDEMDSLMPSRSDSNSNHDASMVAQLLTEMDGLHKDEAVLVIGTTNRLESIDTAFRRPGRFGEAIEIGYPNDDDRWEILRHYDRQFDLGLEDRAIERLVEATRGPLSSKEESDKQRYHDAYKRRFVGEFYDEAGPALHRELSERFGLTQPAEFSGDHLRAICLYLLRESLYRRHELNEPSVTVNDEDFLLGAVDAVRKRGVGSSQKESAPTSFDDIFGDDGRLS